MVLSDNADHLVELSQGSWWVKREVREVGLPLSENGSPSTSGRVLDKWKLIVAARLKSPCRGFAFVSGISSMFHSPRLDKHDCVDGEILLPF